MFEHSVVIIGETIKEELGCDSLKQQYFVGNQSFLESLKDFAYH